MYGMPCAICLGAEGPIRFDVPANHPLAFEADHKVPRARGGPAVGDGVLQPSHRRCNIAKGDGSRSAVSAPATRSTSSTPAVNGSGVHPGSLRVPDGSTGRGAWADVAGLPCRDWDHQSEDWAETGNWVRCPYCPAMVGRWHVS